MGSYYVIQILSTIRNEDMHWERRWRSTGIPIFRVCLVPDEAERYEDWMEKQGEGQKYSLKEASIDPKLSGIFFSTASTCRQYQTCLHLQTSLPVRQENANRSWPLTDLTSTLGLPQDKMYNTGLMMPFEVPQRIFSSFKRYNLSIYLLA